MDGRTAQYGNFNRIGEDECPCCGAFGTLKDSYPQCSRCKVFMPVFLHRKPKQEPEEGFHIVPDMKFHCIIIEEINE